MCTGDGQLLSCQPYAGAKTHIPDQGLGQGPNVVLGLAEQHGLLPGTKLSADNLFNNFELCDHMSERELGLVGTLRQNRVVGVPLPTSLALTQWVHARGLLGLARDMQTFLAPR